MSFSSCPSAWRWCRSPPPSRSSTKTTTSSADVPPQARSAPRLSSLFPRRSFANRRATALPSSVSSNAQPPSHCDRCLLLTSFRAPSRILSCSHAEQDAGAAQICCKGAKRRLLSSSFDAASSTSRIGVGIVVFSVSRSAANIATAAEAYLPVSVAVGPLAVSSTSMMAEPTLLTWRHCVALRSGCSWTAILTNAFMVARRAAVSNSPRRSVPARSQRVRTNWSRLSTSCCWAIVKAFGARGRRVPSGGH